MILLSPSIVPNGAAAAAADKSRIGHYTSVYSEVQTNHLNHLLPVPSVLKSPFEIVDGPPSFAMGNPGEIAKLFPNMFRQPSAMLVSSDCMLQSDQKLKIDVVLSGGQAPIGHNNHVKGSSFYGFRGGPTRIMKCKYVELDSDFIYPYRNQDWCILLNDKVSFRMQWPQYVELHVNGMLVHAINREGLDHSC